jgi:hypothetical protein
LIFNLAARRRMPSWDERKTLPVAARALLF